MKRKLRYWRVDVIHVNGYHAPSTFITTDEVRMWKAEAQALRLAKESCRLADFPDKWVLVPIMRNVVLTNGKLYDI